MALIGLLAIAASMEMWAANVTLNLAGGQRSHEVQATTSVACLWADLHLPRRHACASDDQNHACPLAAGLLRFELLT